MSEIHPSPTIPSYAKFAIDGCEFIGKDLVTTKNLVSVVPEFAQVYYTFNGDLSSGNECATTRFQTRTMTPPEWAQYFANIGDYTNFSTVCNTLSTVSQLCDALSQAGGSPIPSLVADLALIFLSGCAPAGYNTIGKAMTYAYSHNFPNSKLVTVVQCAEAGISDGSGTTWFHEYIYS